MTRWSSGRGCPRRADPGGGGLSMVDTSVPNTIDEQREDVGATGSYMECLTQSNTDDASLRRQP